MHDLNDLNIGMLADINEYNVRSGDAHLNLFPKDSVIHTERQIFFFS